MMSPRSSVDSVAGLSPPRQVSEARRRPRLRDWQWRQHWRSIILGAGPSQRARAEEAIRGLYRLVALDPPQIHWRDSPLAGVMSLLAPLPQRLPSGALGAPITDGPPPDPFAPRPEGVGTSPGPSVASDMLHAAGRLSWGWGPAIASNGHLVPLTDPLREPILRAIQAFLSGRLGRIPEQAWASRALTPQSARWVAHHLEYRDSGADTYSPRECEFLDLWQAVLGSCGWWFPHRRACVISERPESVAVGDTDGLHCDGRPVVRFRDGFSLWYLHSVPVPWWLAELPEERLDPRWLVSIANAQIRREFVRKVGIERICHSLGAQCIDRRGEYELLFLDLGDGRRRPYLKMLNPSSGTWHMEGVHPSCTTVLEALTWRNGTGEPPTTLT